jgi:hypothetical protein
MIARTRKKSTWILPVPTRDVNDFISRQVPDRAATRNAQRTAATFTRLLTLATFGASPVHWLSGFQITCWESSPRQAPRRAEREDASLPVRGVTLEFHAEAIGNPIHEREVAHDGAGIMDRAIVQANLA